MDSLIGRGSQKKNQQTATKTASESMEITGGAAPLFREKRYQHGGENERHTEGRRG